MRLKQQHLLFTSLTCLLLLSVFPLPTVACFARHSGGHLNPAITLAAALSGHLGWVTAGIYMVAQVGAQLAVPRCCCLYATALLLQVAFIMFQDLQVIYVLSSVHSRSYSAEELSGTVATFGHT